MTKFLESNEKPDIEEEVEVDIPAMKSTRIGKASKLYASKKTATKPPSSSWLILHIWIGHENCLGNGGEPHYTPKQKKNMQTWQSLENL